MLLVEEMSIAVKDGMYKKTTSKTSKMFLSSILAGIILAMGGLFYIAVSCGFEEGMMPYGVYKLTTALTFITGLFGILITGTDLYTSSTMTIIPVFKDKFPLSSYFVRLFLVWVGNFVGSLFFVFLCYFSKTHEFNHGGLETQIIALATSKTSNDFVTLLFRGFMANLFVCMAVYFSYAGKTATEKLACTILPITAFVVLGYEHSAANMFSLSYAFILDPETITFGKVAFNIFGATIGNLFAGWFLSAILMGLMDSQKPTEGGHH